MVSYSRLAGEAVDDLIKTLTSPAFVAVASAALTSAFALWQSRDKTRLEERAGYVANVREDSQRKDQRITALEKRVGALEGHIMVVWRWSITLEAALQRHGISIPDGRPDPSSLFGGGDP